MTVGAPADVRGLEVIAATKRFGEIVALDDVSLEVQPGRVLGFLGSNGAGKATAMRAVFGLVELDAGELLWGGRPGALRLVPADVGDLGLGQADEVGRLDPH